MRGENKFTLFTQGKQIEGNFKRSGSGHTVFYDKNGEEIKLTPGKTFVQVIKPDMKLES